MMNINKKLPTIRLSEQTEEKIADFFYVGWLVFLGFWIVNQGGHSIALNQLVLGLSLIWACLAYYFNQLSNNHA